MNMNCIYISLNKFACCCENDNDFFFFFGLYYEMHVYVYGINYANVVNALFHQ